jgi:hypothetical protein
VLLGFGEKKFVKSFCKSSKNVKFEFIAH